MLNTASDWFNLPPVVWKGAASACQRLPAEFVRVLMTLGVIGDSDGSKQQQQQQLVETLFLHVG